MPTIAELLARELDKPLRHVENVIALLDEGNTIPFIARYRNEQHGSMDDTAPVSYTHLTLPTILRV